MNASTSAAARPAFLFDLDGTLIDSVYQHVLAWREALERAGTELSVWRIHRRIGMSGGLLVNALLRETGREISPADAERLQRFHAEAYAKFAPQVRPLPGATDLLRHLAKLGVPHAIATSGRLESARVPLESLGVSPDLPVITRDQVRYAKPDPDLFLAAAERLGVSIHNSEPRKPFSCLPTQSPHGVSNSAANHTAGSVCDFNLSRAANPARSSFTFACSTKQM